MSKKLTVYKTNKGHYAVRPASWAGAWNKDGCIDECLNHTAIFKNEDEAKHYVDLISEEQDGLLVRLPCKVGDTVYFVKTAFTFNTEPKPAQVRKIEIYYNTTLFRTFCGSYEKVFDINDTNKTVFLTHEAAEQALANQHKCKHLGADGVCMLHSDEDYAEHCLLGPCGDEEDESK